MKKTILCASLLAISSAASASEFSLGVTTSYSPAVYKGNDAKFVPFPMISYQGENFYIQGTEVGFSLFPQGTPLNIIPHVKYDGRSLDPDDVDNADLEVLDERKAGLLGGVTIQALTTTGVIEITAGADLSGNHDGVYAEAVWKLPIKTADYLIMPEFGYTYYDSNFNDYYYGVTAKEQADSNNKFTAFDAPSEGQLFASLTYQQKITTNVQITTQVRYSKFGSKVSDSSILDSDDAVSGSVGISYIF